jgi:hypothetical protein
MFFLNPFTFWLFSGTHCRNLVIRGKKIKFGELSIFLSQKSFICVEFIFLRLKDCKKKFPKKKRKNTLPTSHWPFEHIPTGAPSILL